MRGRAMVSLFGALSILGCGETDRSWARPDDDLVPFEPPTARTCDYCVGTAPATFTGPSNFYRGKFQIAPDCEDPTPLQGIQGFLTEPSSLVDFVRECRVTPSDTCKTEGEVCAPIPDEGYSTCVHHVGNVDCPQDKYGTHRDIVLIMGPHPFVMTLCCMAGPEPT